MIEKGSIETSIQDRIGTIEFYHPKSNSLTSELLLELARAIKDLGENQDVNVIVIRSKGDKAFCAGASFDELLEIGDFETGKQFFSGFARVINAMRENPKLIIVRAQGKIVGGGVGLVSAADYALASEKASVRLSEFALGIGPFVVGPAVERKIGLAGFSSMSIDFDWRSAEWAKDKGLFSDIFNNINDLDRAVNNLALKLAESGQEAAYEMKKMFWQGTEHWNELLYERAEISGKLVLSDFTTNYIKQFKEKL